MSIFTSAIAFLAGVSVHLLYFIHGEHHDHAPHLASLVLVACISIFAIQFQSTEASSAAIQATNTILAFAGGLYSSIGTYRIFFHPLRNVPGPRLAAVSKFWHSVKISGLQNHSFLAEMHRKYGDIVRTGPNEVVVMRSEGVPAIHGPGSKCRKAPWYDMLQKERSIHSTRTPQLHQQRRRIWDRGFGTKALRQYQDRIAEHVDRFSANIQERLGSSRNITNLCYFFGFDVMGDTAFGKDFNMLKSNVEHPIVKIMRGGIYIIGRFTPVPWLVTILSSIPGANGDFKRLESYAEDSIMKLSKMNSGGDDIMSKLIDAARSTTNPEKIDMYYLGGDAMTVIIAGSDTVAIAMTFLLYHLALIPGHISKLREELKGVNITDNRALQTLKHLNAMINETLRLFPPVPTGPLRQTPPEGLQIGENFIPGNVAISTPLYIIGRLESSYERASEFLPERWYEGSTMIKDVRGFAPFLSGTHSCPGKQLALIEIRLLTSRLVTQFDFKFADESKKFETVSNLKDCFTAVPGPLNLVFSERASD
ncbi:cytochrome P450 [Periconia macrospinosa]|uniref:Cytochrome P450 n=1 Tax=Periconia macrospinosa TaxID=97972 RepID=A0A2V1DY63_9PLEO|nr:cytochrome P450 [Periconia macrospinosa]